MALELQKYTLKKTGNRGVNNFKNSLYDKKNY